MTHYYVTPWSPSSTIELTHDTIIEDTTNERLLVSLLYKVRQRAISGTWFYLKKPRRPTVVFHLCSNFPAANFSLQI